MRTLVLSNTDLYARYPELQGCKADITSAIKMMTKSFENKGKVLVAGNGGSSSDAEHFCGELVKGFLLPRSLSKENANKYDKIDESLKSNLQEGLPCISLGVSHSLVSAFSNDMSWEYAFAQQVHVLGNPEDIFFGISTSGNSQNVVNAALVAKGKGIKVVALTGEKESRLNQISDVCIKAPSEITHIAQEFHLPIYHFICIELEKHFYG